MVSPGSVGHVWLVLCAVLASCLVGCAATGDRPATRPATRPTTAPAPATRPTTTATTRPIDAKLVARLRALQSKEGQFGPAYQPIYHAALPWYEEFGGKKPGPIDDWAVAPEVYAAELADAMEHGRNYIAENEGASFPLYFEKTLANGTVMKTNYMMNLAAGFAQPGQKFPLVIGLPGSGWIAHKISYGRGGKTGGRCFSVTPICERGPWNIEFLNAYLDELCRMFPIDQDHVYVEGHSMGGIATWEWAMNNPERFAAISPRSAYGSPMRVARLKYVPAWVVHGSADDSVFSGYGDQMVFAMRAAGETVKYTLIKGGAHNLPPDFDGKAVVDWYLQQTRSHEPAPADPIDALGIGASGFSEMVTIALKPERMWKSQTLPIPARGDRAGGGAGNNAQKALFDKVHAKDGMVDSLIRQEIDPAKNMTTYYLAVPQALLNSTQDDAEIVTLPAREGVRFYGRGDLPAALAHVKEIAATLKAQGKVLSDKVWMTPFTPRRSANSASEFWIEVVR